MVATLRPASLASWIAYLWDDASGRQTPFDEMSKEEMLRRIDSLANSGGAGPN